MHVDAVKRHLDVRIERIGDVVDEVLGHGADVGAVLEDDVDIDVDAGLRGRDLDAAAEAVRRQQRRDAVLQRGRGHPDDAVAFHRGLAGDVGDYVIGDMQVA